MKKLLKYLAAALLFSFSVSSHAERVSNELASRVVHEGEPIASGSTGSDDGNVWLITSLRYAGLIYFCRINWEKWGKTVTSWCFDGR